jgi:hypothetical protein
MADRTENEKAASEFDADLRKLLKQAKRRNEQLWPGVVGQLEMAQHHTRSMMHPDDAAKAR